MAVLRRWWGGGGGGARLLGTASPSASDGARPPGAGEASPVAAVPAAGSGGVDLASFRLMSLPPDGPGRLGAVKRPWRFPMKIHFVWGFCMYGRVGRAGRLTANKDNNGVESSRWEGPRDPRVPGTRYCTRIQAQEVAHTKVLYLPIYREAKCPNLLLYNGIQL
jgi:hypothetical protein